MTEEPSFLTSDIPDDMNVGRNILLPEAPAHGLLLGSLERVFAEDDNLEVVALHWAARRAYARREDFLDWASPTMRSVGIVGDADQLFLPGRDQIHSIALSCPIDGEQFDFFFFDPGGIRYCPQHPGTRLEVTVGG